MPRAKKVDSPLGEFEGKAVEGIKIIITKTGDGLSQAMTVAPKLLHQGNTGYIVLSYVTNKIRFDPVKADKDDPDAVLGTHRIQILEATGATFVDRDLVGDIVEAMRDRIRKQKEEASGIFRLEDAAEDSNDDLPF